MRATYDGSVVRKKMTYDEEEEELECRALHVYPLSEQKFHQLFGRDCQCEPDVEIREDGHEVVIHRRLVQ